MKKQMNLKNFCKEFDIPRTTAIRWINSEGFPAYKICKNWYIDVDEFLRWRKKKHQQSYKYC